MLDKASSGQPEWLALRTKIGVKRAAELNGISEDCFRRNYPHLIRKITPRRDVVTLADALAIGTNKQSA